jgi:hypothetical protein
MRASSFLLASALFAVALPLHAERYGSETALTLQGTYYRPGETTTLLGVDHASYGTHRVTNATILASMAHDGLIDGVKGYSLVMVARAHAADGVKFFATHRTKTPVEVPSSLLSLHVEDGPMKGTALFSVDGDLKDLARQTLNPAEILQGDFLGMAILSQKWTEKAVKANGVTEVVELVSGSGTFEGLVDDEDEPGVGTLVFRLTGAKPVDLTRYGMASTGESSGTTGGVVKIGNGNTSLLNNSAVPLIKTGTIVLAGSNTYVGSFIQGPAEGILTSSPIFGGVGSATIAGSLILDPSAGGELVFSDGILDYSGLILGDFTLSDTFTFSDAFLGSFEVISLEPATGGEFVFSDVFTQSDTFTFSESAGSYAMTSVALMRMEEPMDRSVMTVRTNWRSLLVQPISTPAP